MRRITIMLIVALLLMGNICFAASAEYLYTDALGTKVYLEAESIKSITYIWDCYKASTKLVFNKPISNITYSKMYFLIKKENKDYAIVYIENYDANDQLVSSTDKANEVQWTPYDKNNQHSILIDKVFGIAKQVK